MPLQFSIGYPDAHKVILRHLSSRVASTVAHPLGGRIQGATATDLDVSNVKLKFPHAVYQLLHNEVASGGGLETARHRFFRYIIYVSDEPVAAVEVPIDPSGSAKRVSSLYKGGFVKGTTKALEELAAYGLIQSGLFEPRLLLFPAVHLTAIWLKSEMDEEDIIYPLAPIPDWLGEQKPYSVVEFGQIAQPIVQAKTASMQSGPG